MAKNGYYRDKQEFNSSIKTLITTTPPGKKVYLHDLEIKYGVDYGYGKTTIIKALKPYQQKGIITLNNEYFELDPDGEI